MRQFISHIICLATFSTAALAADVRSAESSPKAKRSAHVAKRKIVQIDLRKNDSAAKKSKISLSAAIDRSEVKVVNVDKIESPNESDIEPIAAPKVSLAAKPTSSSAPKATITGVSKPAIIGATKPVSASPDRQLASVTGADPQPAKLLEIGAASTQPARKIASETPKEKEKRMKLFYKNFQKQTEKELGDDYTE